MERMNRGAFSLPGTSLHTKTGDWRTERPVYTPTAAPCHTACPAGEDAQAYLDRVAEHDFLGAWEILVKANPLPAITGRVCHHPCESQCNRGRFDEPVAIHQVERNLGDEALKEGWSYPLSTPPADAARIAVVGAGPSGLSAAYHLVRLGHRVSLFEAQPFAGGMMRAAIPPYRLPREVVDAELERLLGIEGVSFYPNHSLGHDMHLDELRADYSATFLGVGTQASVEWDVDGASPDDLHNGLALLQEAIDFGVAPEWQAVAIVGAGNTAIDLARMLVRAGVGKVHVISHKSIPAPGVQPIDQMTALPEEIRQALEEGVIIHEHQGVQRLILRGGEIAGLELVSARKLDYGDRLKRTVFEGTETVLGVDQVIPAIGQSVAPSGLESLLNGNQFLPADYWGRLEGEPTGLYVGGDARGDHGMVSEAIGDGRRAAQQIDHCRRDNARTQEEKETPISYEQLNIRYFQPARRVEASLAPAQERVQSNSEIEASLSLDETVEESTRCLSCGQCMRCDNCWNLCPDAAVLVVDKPLQEGGRKYIIDYDYCKGCGLCARECPTGYIRMHPESEY